MNGPLLRCPKRWYSEKYCSGVERKFLLAIGKKSIFTAITNDLIKSHPAIGISQKLLAEIVTPLKFI
jgi:hypothetical protein